MFRKKTILHFGYHSDKGPTRELNEDNLGWYDPGDDTKLLSQKGRLFIVADGMGGYSAGEVASRLAVKTLIQVYPDATGANMSESLTFAIQQTNEAIYHHSQTQGSQGMGTTLVCAVVHGNELYIASIGDSRIYLYRGHRLTQLTEDQTFVNELVKAGAITPEAAKAHPRRHVITQALGKQEKVIPDIQGPLSLQDDDLILLCTDGISGYLEPEQIGQILKTYAMDPQAASAALTQVASTVSGKDNVTALVIRIDQSFL